ncbi:MAG: hypothetical protein LBB59_04130 [Campylobacteraceae bacterium]|jgi:hypothetical protein|nr:hypothetical protein [Campylobacteraceae bacterium]
MMFKKAASTASLGVYITLFGIFLFILLLVYYDSACFVVSRCMSMNLYDMFKFMIFCMMFAGVLIELKGVFLPSKAAQDIDIFYNKLNLYLALFVAFQIKIAVIDWDNFFLIGIWVDNLIEIIVELSNHYNEDFIMRLAAAKMPLIVTLIAVYFLCKNSIQLLKVFHTVKPKNIFIRWTVILLLALFVLGFIVSVYDAAIAFLPYLLSLLITYRQISKAPEAHKAAAIETIVFLILFSTNLAKGYLEVSFLTGIFLDLYGTVWTLSSFLRILQ